MNLDPINKCQDFLSVLFFFKCLASHKRARKCKVCCAKVLKEKLFPKEYFCKLYSLSSPKGKSASLEKKDEGEGKLFQTAARACNESTFVTVYVSFCYRGMDKSWVMRRPLLRRQYQNRFYNCLVSPKIDRSSMAT